MSGSEKAPNADNIVDVGEEHHKTGRLQEAEACYRRALEIDPGHPGALYFLANIAYEDGRLPFAAQLIEELLHGEPDDAEAWHLLGMISLKEANTARASESFRRALAVQPAYPQAHYSLGTLLSQQGDFDGALASFQGAITLNPMFAEAHCSIGNIFKAQNKYEEALSSYQQALNAKSNFLPAFAGIGEIFSSQGKPEKAIAIFREAIAENADSAPAHAGLGKALLSANQNAAAVISFERAIELKPDCAEVYNNLGRALQNLDRFDEALINYDKAIAFIPYYPEAYYNRGNALQSLKRFDEALISYDKAIALEPDYAEARHSRDNVLLSFKQMNEGSSELAGLDLKNANLVKAASAAIEQVLPSYRTVRASKPMRVYKCPPPPAFESHYANYRYAPDRFVDKNTFMIDGHEVRVLDRLREPEVVVFENVLSDVECELLISLSRPKLQRSAIYDRTSHAGEAQVSTERTSEGTFFQREENAFIRTLEIRLAKLMNLSGTYGERLQILHYATGAEYLPHYDFFAPEDASSAALLQAGGQRVATLIMYLNDVEGGGATIFPEIDFAVQPRRGGGVYFSYCDEAGKLDRLTLHGGAPVTYGEKWVATKWVRRRLC